ncbi:MAG: YlxR family protein [Acidimicrobiales bacterium]
MAPQRTCVVCRARRDDSLMVRVGRRSDGTWYVGRGSGRGIWWCRESTCEASLHVGHLARALRSSVGPGDLEVLLATYDLGRLKAVSAVVEE